MKNLLLKMFRKKYEPEKFWDDWAMDFMKDPWQVKIHPQHKWLLSIIKKQKPNSILEIGCGFGRNIKFLIENGVKSSSIVGIDISPNMVRFAKQYVDNSRVKLFVSNLRNFKTNKKFDLVFTHGVLMHVQKDQIEEAINKLIDLSKKDVVLVEQNYKANNNYTFIHDFKKLLKGENLVIIEYRKDKKLGLDLIYAQVR